MSEPRYRVHRDELGGDDAWWLVCERAEQTDWVGFEAVAVEIVRARCRTEADANMIAAALNATEAGLLEWADYGGKVPSRQAWEDLRRERYEANEARVAAEVALRAAKGATEAGLLERAALAMDWASAYLPDARYQSNEYIEAWGRWIAIKKALSALRAAREGGQGT